jgi:hypothetical protein
MVQVHCWKIESEYVDEDDPMGIQIKKTKGGNTVEGKYLDNTMPYYGRPIKTKSIILVYKKHRRCPSSRIIGTRKQ